MTLHLVHPVRRTRTEYRLAKGVAKRDPATLPVYVVLRAALPGTVVAWATGTGVVVALTTTGPIAIVFGAAAAIAVGLVLAAAAAYTHAGRSLRVLTDGLYLRAMREDTPPMSQFSTRAALVADFVERHGPANTWMPEVHEEFAHRVEHAASELPFLPAWMADFTIEMIARPDARPVIGGPSDDRA
ncbi:hypothetical protein [Streptomyces sp. SID3343]|uniref:hypothetical protein n=1 Tax=Streptomyces sp. SID3343 TaxID=2690260 RepID=UPI001370802E|nr:hypothetical protein [Streptomyces sp. SID3343]MYW00048.1 hypothetical protein [Streptomyces sp. SID3343]